MGGGWLVSCSCLLLLKATFEPALEVALLAGWSGAFSGITYFLFVLPVIAPLPRDFQLRYFVAIVMLSLGWDCLVMRSFLREWPWAVQTTEAGLFFPVWFGVFTLSALAIYFALLWRGARTARHAAALPQLLA